MRGEMLNTMDKMMKGEFSMVKSDILKEIRNHISVCEDHICICEDRILTRLDPFSDSVYYCPDMDYETSKFILICAP